MIELFIDDVQCDIEVLPIIPIGFDAENLTKAMKAYYGSTLCVPEDGVYQLRIEN